jgi:hypothetical protein
MENLQNNIEKGLAEIIRRENLFIASLCLMLPYGLCIMWPASSLFGNLAYFVLVPLIAFYGKLYLWLIKTPCPRCGNPIGDFNKVRSRKCTSCSLEIKSPDWFGNKISFRKIDYIPGGSHIKPN